MQLDLIDPRPYQHKSILIITQTMQSIKNQYQQGNDQNNQSAPPDVNNNTKKNTKRLLLRLKRRRGAPLPVCHLRCQLCNACDDMHGRLHRRVPFPQPNSR